MKWSHKNLDSDQMIGPMRRSATSYIWRYVLIGPDGKGGNALSKEWRLHLHVTEFHHSCGLWNHFYVLHFIKRKKMEKKFSTYFYFLLFAVGSTCYYGVTDNCVVPFLLLADRSALLQPSFSPRSGQPGLGQTSTLRWYSEVGFNRNRLRGRARPQKLAAITGSFVLSSTLCVKLSKTSEGSVISFLKEVLQFWNPGMPHPDKVTVNPGIFLQAQSHNGNHEKKGQHWKSPAVKSLSASRTKTLFSFFFSLHDFHFSFEFGDNWMKSSLRERDSFVIRVSLTK